MTRNARRIHRTDGIQAEILDALHRAGCTTQSLSSIGGGCPDLLVARAGKLWLMELKSADGELAPAQREWSDKWNSPVYLVRTVAQALTTVGLQKQ